MPGRGPQTFKKRQKEQQRKEKQQEKMAKRLARKDETDSPGGEDSDIDYDAAPRNLLYDEPEADADAANANVNANVGIVNSRQ